MNKTKKIVCVLVVFSLILQVSLYPLTANAEERGLWQTLKRIFSRIAVPNQVIFNEQGDLKIGTNTDDDWIVDLPCMAKNDKGNCTNPLNDIDDLIFGKQETNPLLDEHGNLNIAVPVVPGVCQLNLAKPIEKGGEDVAEDEQLARRRACNDLIRLQKAAAQEAFVARSIYVKTNPKSDCLFLKNCKSVCALRFGEVNYVVTIFDIAEFLLPTGWVSVVHKIINVIAMFGDIKDVFDAAVAILTDGIELVNTAIKTFNYLANLYAALDNLGGSLSGALGVALVVTSASGVSVPGGNITTGVAAGVASAAVLAKSFGGMKEMLGRFSDNMLAYGQAKSEALQMVSGTRMDIVNIIEGGQKIKGLKKEPKLAFLFQPQNSEDQKKKNDLEKLIADYRSFFENSTQLLHRTSLPGELVGGSVLEVATGTNSGFDALNRQDKAYQTYKFGELADTVYGERVSTQNFCDGSQPPSQYHFNPIYRNDLGSPGRAEELITITNFQ